MFEQNPKVRSAAEIAIEFHTAVPSGLFRNYLNSIYNINSITGLLEKTGTISMNGKGLADISGIEYAQSVTVIDFGSNAITTNVDLSGLSALTSISFYLNGIGSIGKLSALTALTYAHCSNNLLDDIGNLSALTLLSYLHMQDNLLADIGDLSALDKFTYLNLGNNQFSQSALEGIIDDLYGNRVALAGLSCNVILTGNPGSVGATASKSAEIATMNGLGMVVTI